MNGNIRMQARSRLPGAVADAGNELPCFPGRMQRHGPAVAKHGEAVVYHARHLDLHPLYRGVHAARGAAAGRFFAEDVPGFEGVTQLQLDAARGDRANERKAKLEVGSEPFAAETISSSIEIAHHIFPVKLHEMGKHEAIVQA